MHNGATACSDSLENSNNSLRSTVNNAVVGGSLLFRGWTGGARSCPCCWTHVPEHYNEVAHRRITLIEKTLAAVHERLSNEIAFWQDRWLKLKEDGEAGKYIRLKLENARSLDS